MKFNRNTSENGQGAVEFALVLVLVVVVGIVVLTLLGPQITKAYNDVLCALPNPPPDIVCGAGIH